MRVGVLALQGAFREHKQALLRLGCEVTEVRLPQQLTGLAGVIIPGGESTTMAKLMQDYGLDAGLKAFYEAGGALWGTCAGAITLATELVDFAKQPRLGLLDITLARNAYGRQVASFETEVEVSGLGPFRAFFIRAPRIVRVGPAVTVCASFAGDPVMVQKDGLLATVFHPELSGDDRIHRYFIEVVAGGSA
ncbi:MAG: pyridoxal 5'-phosphate synthase glutaminase subunit PdxT [Truepera sp.]|nr:pyridoxal 5'-phosphate synthase glutaminase subunit PdxT [Truepera sp.]